jgi:hypothetical protein
MHSCAACGAAITPGATDCSRCSHPVIPEPKSPIQRDTLDPTDGVIGNLWEGNYTLVKTYWLFGTVGGIALTLAFIMLVELTASRPIVLLGLAALCAWQIFISVAIWRSATKYTGTAIWKVLAKIAVVLGAFRLANELVSLFGGA